MKLFLSILMAMTISLSQAQSIKESLKNPDGDLKILFVSSYKIKTRNKYSIGKNYGKTKVYKTDKSMKDDNSLLYQF
ncbi:MAG: hypothetical protein COB15_16650 [Flavobacteriales bacterium]|nr:MAG: hypothetical protein COB15_16650 [Flavobacteriales bacterium]